MKSIVNETYTRGISAVTIALLAVGIAAASAARAGKGPTASAGQAVEIVGRVNLTGGPATRMVLVEKDRKQYLYISQDSSADLSVVDVTKSNKARVVGRTAVSAPAASGELLPLGDTRAMILTTPEGPATTTPNGTDSQAVTILDVEDPAFPMVSRKFTGVTSLVTDNARSLIYIANSEGLWILKAKDKTHGALSLAEEQDN